MFVKSTILIVDDDQELCYLLAAVLQKLDADIFIENTIHAATLRLHQIQPSLILLDNRMPDGLGIQFVAIIEQVHPKTGIILMTGQSSKMLRQTAIDVGCIYFLNKPFDVNELVKLVEHVIMEREVKVKG